MSYKTILVHCDANPRLSQRLDVAVDLAQRYAAHLVGAHMQAPMDIPAFSGGVMPMPMYDFFAAYEASVKAEHDTAAAAFTKAMKGTHLPSEWRVAKGYPENELAIQARYADLLVVGQTDPEGESPTPTDLPESLALSTRAPDAGRPAHRRSLEARQIGHAVLERQPRERARRRRRYPSWSRRIRSWS